MAIIKHYPDILDCIANLSNDEVFTPPVLVNKILDLLPADVWTNPNLKWLDPSCKTGVFLREIAKRLWVGLAEAIPEEDRRREHIFKEMLWGIALTELTALTSRRSLYYSKNPQSTYSVVPFENVEGNIYYSNMAHIFSNKVCTFCGASEESQEQRTVENNEMHAYNFIHQDISTIFKGKNMKFDVIVGNPPYQLNDGGHGASASPLYHLFIENAKKLNPQYLSMIIPARWYAGGKGLDKFREEMLNDKHMKILVDHTDASECFPGVEIKGGVCYFLWDNSHHGKCEIINKIKDKESSLERDLNEHNIFVRFNSGISILNKVKTRHKGQFLSDKVESRNPFGISTNFSDFKKDKSENGIKIYARGAQGYVNKALITKNVHLIPKYKIIIPKAGEGDGKFPNKIIGKPIFIEKDSCCTETYLVIGSYDLVDDAKNFEGYINTKFVRFLIGLIKTTQDTSKDKFYFVPDLPMNEEWTDEKLYKKYNLSKEDIDFIESMIKPM